MSARVTFPAPRRPPMGRERRCRSLVLLLVLGPALVVGAGAGDWVRLTVLHTSDIHAHVGVDDPDRDWLRLATAIREETVAAGGRSQCLLLDTGDAIQGSLAGVVTRGEIGIRLLNRLHYDAWVPGNHDFDFGVSRFRHLLQQTRVPVLQGNIRLDGGPNLPPFRIFQRAGLQVAVVGLNASALRGWLWGEQLAGVGVIDAVDAVAACLPTVIRRHPDIVIVAMHHGWREHDRRHINEIRDIAERFPEVDIILGGHTHRRIPGRRLGASWFAQPGRHAQALGVIKVSVERETRRVVSVTSGLHAVDRTTPRDAAASAAVAADLKRTAAFATMRVCTLDAEVSARGRPGVDCAMSELFCAALADASAADVVFHGTLSSTSWPAGELSEGQLFAAIPYENAIVTTHLSRADIVTIVEEQAANEASGRFCGIWGAEATLSRTTGRVTALDLPPPTGSSGRWRVTFNGYTAAGAGRRFPRLAAIVRRPDVGVETAAITSREAVRRYLRQAGHYAPTAPKRYLHDAAPAGAFP